MPNWPNIRYKDDFKKLFEWKKITICNPTRVTSSIGRGNKSINGMTLSVLISFDDVVAYFASPNPCIVNNARTKTLRRKKIIKLIVFEIYYVYSCRSEIPVISNEELGTFHTCSI